MQLAVASDEQKRAIDRVSFDAWGDRLTRAQWLEREARLRASPWARDAMQTWILVDDGGTILSSCETYRMDGFVAGERRDVWGVASVFTGPQRRGRGLATTLIDRLVEETRAAGALASILFSDVAPRQYQRSGYVTRPAIEWVLPPLDGDPAAGVDVLIADGEPDGVEELRPDDPGLVVWPSPAQLDWHVERGRTYAALLGLAPPATVGARYGDGLVRWAVRHVPRVLKVQLLATNDVREAQRLLRAAQRTAGLLGLREVHVWAQPWPFAAGELGAERVERSDEIPMIAPLAGPLQADDWRHIPQGVWV